MRLLCLAAMLAGCVLPDATRAPVDVLPADDAPSLRRLAEHVHGETNAARRAHAASRLGWSDALARVARDHSRDMARRSYFDHVSPDGETPSERARAAGISCERATGNGRYSVGVAENLYWTTRYERVRERTVDGRVERDVDWLSPAQIAGDAVEGWLGSPGHRRNLLNRTFTVEGVGVATAGDRVYITQVFC